MSEKIRFIKSQEEQHRAEELLAMLPQDVQKRITDKAYLSTTVETSDEGYYSEVISLAENELKSSVKIDTSDTYNEFDKHYALLSVKQQQFLRSLGTDLLNDSHDSFDESNLKAHMAGILTFEGRSKAEDHAREAFLTFSRKEMN